MSPPANDRVPKLGLARTWAVLGILSRHLWPKGETGLRIRVVVALGLLILAKVVNVYVPLLYKHAVDALGEPTAQAIAVPVVLILAYGAARVLAQRVLKTAGPKAEDRLTLAFRLTACRTPQPRELTILQASLDQHLAHYRQDKAAAQKLVSLGEAPRDAKLDVAELAAYAALCNALLNLDEVITKE